ncbi:MAG: family 43 glycosylhydrolase [Proteiniphilum sp.]
MSKRNRMTPSVARKPIYCFVAIFSFLMLGCATSEVRQKVGNVVANPMNLNYRFQFDEPSRREAADPVIVLFKEKYYLFASKSGGYWSSDDLCEWTYIPCKSIGNIEEYAPAVLALDDELYYMGSGQPRIYKTGDPDTDNWEEMDTKFRYPLVGSIDPAFFRDDDGRVYVYWGCSDKDPIIGVEVDPKDGFNVIGEASVLIEHHSDKYGWEVSGHNNDNEKDGWNEGPCLIKHKGRYYLHYASPGTEFRVYGDGTYVSDNPLGPYTYEENSPFSFKPGGFIGGAGHGHTFRDKYDNYWHVATMRITARHFFERRLGLFPVYFSDDSCLYAHTVFTDYPYQIPQEKVDLENHDLSMNWNLLSYRKKVLASSSLSGHEAEYGNDEQVETWWASQTGKKGEWWQVDLGEAMTVHALQVNFADQDFDMKAPDSFFNYQYLIEYSIDGDQWKVLTDKSKNENDRPHELLVFDAGIEIQFLRITNTKEMKGKFSLFDFRVFGKGHKDFPRAVSQFDVSRDSDRRKITFRWNAQDNTTGYILRWGVKRDQLNNAVMVFENQFEGRFFNRDSEYYFSIDAFNESGITKGTTILERM